MDYAFNCLEELKKFKDWKDAPLTYLKGAAPLITRADLEKFDMDWEEMEHYYAWVADMTYRDFETHFRKNYPRLYPKKDKQLTNTNETNTRRSR